MWFLILGFGMLGDFWQLVPGCFSRASYISRFLMERSSVAIFCSGSPLVNVAPLLCFAFVAMPARIVATIAALAAALLAAPASAVSLRRGANATASADVFTITKRTFMEVSLGPFTSASEACDYCFSSFTKQGTPPAGPITEECVCMAYPDGGGHNMFCATPPSAAGFIKSKNGCRCKGRDMENMGATTCEPIR